MRVHLKNTNLNQHKFNLPYQLLILNTIANNNGWIDDVKLVPPYYRILRHWSQAMVYFNNYRLLFSIKNESTH